MSKPTVPEVMPIVRALYARHSAGCCWHVVLDDGNVDSVGWTVGYIRDGDCRAVECLALAELLPKMSKTQILKLANGHYRRSTESRSTDK